MKKRVMKEQQNKQNKHKKTAIKERKREYKNKERKREKIQENRSNQVEKFGNSLNVECMYA